MSADDLPAGQVGEPSPAPEDPGIPEREPRGARGGDADLAAARAPKPRTPHDEPDLTVAADPSDLPQPSDPPGGSDARVRPGEPASLVERVATVDRVSLARGPLVTGRVPIERAGPGGQVVRVHQATASTGGTGTGAPAEAVVPAETESPTETPPAGPARPLTAGWRHRLAAGGALAWRWAVTAAPQLVLAATLLAVAIGAVLRFATPSHLWLDESLTVGIASRPVPDLLEALRHDGSPPLYYLLLHGWITLFGDGDIAVRSLSGVLSLATLPLAWFAGRFVGRAATALGNGGPSTEHRVGLAALLLFACSPYAIRYGSETRMYSLVVLLVLVFGFAIVRALERSSRPRLVLLTLATAALVYTHYWTFLLVFTVAAFLLVQARRRRPYRRPALRAFGAMAASAVLFAPWMPVFLFQMLHTGTPWAPRVQAQVLLDTVFDWAGPQSTGALLGIILLGGALIGLTARPLGRELHVKISGRAPGRYLAAIWLVPLLLAYFVNMFGGSAYAERYTGIALPACLLLASLGIAQVPVHRAFAAVLVAASVSGLLGGYQLARTERTQAGEIADRIARIARPGDVLAYCPDQLGPAVHRAIVRRGDIDVREIVYADEAGPALVDWVDYADRMKRANGAAFASEVNELAGPDHAVLLVRADGYRFLEGACAVLSDQLAALRDRALQVEKRNLYEGASLERFSTLR